MIEQVRNNVPLIHCITNYVTVGDVANMILAAGGSPIMADGIHEVEDITSICRGLVINIGTLNERTIASMLKAGKKAAELGHPIVFDPVGAGASAFRTETAMKILAEIPCTVIRGNVSEIKTIAGELGQKTGDCAESNVSRGVDSNELDVVTEDNLEQMCEFAKALSRKTGAVLAITGAIDVVADCDHAYVIRNGHAMMAKVTGTGCMLDGVIAAYVCGGGSERTVAEAAAEAIAAEGLCGELAYKKILEHNGGTGSFRMYLFDFMSRLNDGQLDGGKRIEIR